MTPPRIPALRLATLLSATTLIAASLALPLWADDAPKGMLVRAEGFSGLVKIGKHEYLTVHDRKAKSDDARLARVEVVKEGMIYQPIWVADWKGERANDLEGVCRLPTGDFLAAESGVREGQFGRIFRLELEKDDTAKVRAVYAGAKVLESNKDGKGDDYEGLLCVPVGGKVLVMQGERGGSKAFPRAMLRWGWLDLEGDTLTFSKEGLAGIEVAPKSRLVEGAEQRDIADLYADAKGVVWAVAATDSGDSGPFRSYIYRLGTLQPEQNPPIRLEKELKASWTIDGFKIESLAEAWTKDGALAFGTEDEDIGGVLRELFPPLD